MTETVPQFTPPIPAPDTPIFQAPDPSGTRKGSPVPPGVQRLFRKVGENKATTASGKPSRNAPRALTDDDKRKIADMYEFIAGGLTLVGQVSIADAITEEVRTFNADTNEWEPGPRRQELCADAWYELAEENDAVRRFLLFWIESGAWSKLFAAHVPILLAALPADALARLMAVMMPPRKTEPVNDNTVRIYPDSMV